MIDFGSVTEPTQLTDLCDPEELRGGHATHVIRILLTSTRVYTLLLATQTVDQPRSEQVWLDLVSLMRLLSEIGVHDPAWAYAEPAKIAASLVLTLSKNHARVPNAVTRRTFDAVWDALSTIKHLIDTQEKEPEVEIGILTKRLKKAERSLSAALQ